MFSYIKRRCYLLFIRQSRKVTILVTAVTVSMETFKLVLWNFSHEYTHL